MKTSKFNYDLPTELIAQTPLPNRAESRLLALDKKTGEIEHRRFGEITDFLRQGDCLVVNDTRVLPARLLCRKETGGKVEILLLREIESTGKSSIWETLVKPGRKLKKGDRLLFKNGNLEAEIGDRLETGSRIVALQSDLKIKEAIRLNGNLPLPPYIKTELNDQERYQTVYSEKEGSAAAPTAGLHFTEELLEKISGKGVRMAKITLDVGLDTFRPVKTENIEDHLIHKEKISLSPRAAETINKTREIGGRIIAVGTTAVRTIESCAKNGRVVPYFGETGLFIYPGYKFRMVDCLITNFHLPKSTLLMLVCAFGGYEKVMEAYREAIKMHYRFFSFGDAMLIF
jgi:S-adenosylmethionine:tRNA ribosyltransferase-isomerase